MSGPLTDTQLRATAVPISGTVTATPTGTQNVDVTANTIGLATVAKQPALGTAGTSSADVITVQGRAAMTPVLVDGTATTQPVSGSVTANIGTVATLATAAKQDTLDTSVNTLLKPANTLAGVTTVSTVTNLVQQNGVAISTGTGVRDAGTQRVTIATNDSVPVTQVVGPASTTVLVKASSAAVTAATGTATIIAAPGAGLFNYITSISVANTGTVSTLVSIYSGTSATIIYRTFAPALGGSNITFPTPLKCAVNEVLGFIIATTPSGDVYVSAAGYTGA